MKNFIINVEDSKKLLSVLYSLPYHQAVPFVEIMHSLKEEDGEVTLLSHLKQESNNQVKEQPESV